MGQQFSGLALGDLTNDAMAVIWIQSFQWLYLYPISSAV